SDHFTQAGVGGVRSLAQGLLLLQRCDNENLTNFMFKTLNPGYENDSLSPWTYEDDVNDNRYPRIIRVAKCDPLGCSGLNATSEAITIEIPVFMRVKCGQHSKSNTAVYRLTLVHQSHVLQIVISV
uniref:Uncharacterized protein n=1 Tax=Pygocentrus nattereri TaxID=42514 RepID=A0A3B4DN46_PYGNA